MPTKYEDLEAFQRARVLVKYVYVATSTFPQSELYGLTSQMRRAALSVLSHIAEGQGRLTYGEWRQMLSQARGSLYEVEAQTIAAGDLEYLNEKQVTFLRKKVTWTGQKLAGLIRWVQIQESVPKRKQQPATSNQQPPSATTPPPKSPSP